MYRCYVYVFIDESLEHSSVHFLAYWNQGLVPSHLVTVIANQEVSSQSYVPIKGLVAMGYIA